MIKFKERVGKVLVGIVMCLFAVGYLSAQTNLFVGTQSRVVVFARFNGDPEIDTPRSSFYNMFNGATNSLQSYFKAISNDKLTVSSLLYPANSPSYELKYCYYCYDSSWRGSYPNCKGNDITSLFDINIGFIIKELATKLETSENLPDANALDADNDGYVDNFVIVFRGAGRGAGKGVHTPQVGTISSTFTNTNGEIQIKGKTIRNYTITYERNSLDTHCRFLLSYMGFPAQYRNLKTLPRVAGQWDPMDGPLLSYPLVYNRMKYTNGNWIENIPLITEPGIYSLSSADNATNNAYKLLSSNGSEFWVLEFRDKSVNWEDNIPESGLIIYRVNPAYSGSVGANAEIYLYRKDGTPTVSGDIANAPFSNLNGQTVFNSGSNPYSFFTDGSTSHDINISDITFQNGKISFSVNKVYADVDAPAMAEWQVHASVASDKLYVEGEGIEQMKVFDLAGHVVGDYDVRSDKTVHLNELPSGILFVQLRSGSDQKVVKIVI